MFLKLNVTDANSKEIVTEICTFEGMRYDADAGLAILSTEHSAHDYLMPMSRKDYDYMVEKVFSCVSKSLIKPGLTVQISGSPLIRVKHGSATRVEDVGSYSYGINMQFDNTKWVLQAP